VIDLVEVVMCDPPRWKWSCVIDLVYETERVTPFLEILQKKVL
jgi:hypothetical protein